MAFCGPDLPADRLLDADMRREGLTLDADEVARWVEEMPDEDIVMERWIEELRAIDATAMKIPVRARRAIEEALSLREGDLWEVKK